MASPIHYGTDGRGQRLLDIGKVIDLFEAQEGIVEHVIGKTGNGKTYEGTRRAIEDLLKGEVVYTTWELILPEKYDQRKSWEHLIFNFLFGKKYFYRFDLKKNWHYLDIDREDLLDFIESLTDCKLYMDEGQDVFDSRGGIDKRARKTITRSRHMRKTLIIISQRAQAVDVNARANVSYFYKCIKTFAWWWPFRPYFKIYRTDEMDDQNYPVWEERLPDGKMWKAPLWRSHFADDKIFNAYNSWYLRKGKKKSQEIHLEAFELSRMDMLDAMIDLIEEAKEKKRSMRITRKLEKQGVLPKQPSEFMRELSTVAKKSTVLSTDKELSYTHDEGTRKK